ITPMGGNQFIVTPSQNRIFTFTANVNGCSSPGSKLEIKVNKLKGIIMADSLGRKDGIVFCDSINLPATIKREGSYHFQWSPPTHLSDPTILNPIAKPTHNTWYYLTAQSGNCSIRDSVLLIPRPGINTKLEVSKKKVCQGDTLLAFAKRDKKENPLQEWLEWWPSKIIKLYRGDSVILQPDATTKVSLKILSGECFKEDTVTIKVFPKPKLDIWANTLKGCQGDTLHFVDNSKEVNARTWKLVDEPLHNEKEVRFHFPRAGNFNLHYVGIGKEGCMDSLIFPIQIGPLIKARVHVQPQGQDTLQVPNALVRLEDLTAGVSERIWDLGDGSTSTLKVLEYRYTHAGKYKIRLWVQSETGCQDSITKQIWVVEPQLIVPNIFTPNNDGINDFWQIGYNGGDEVEIRVFDRWGKVVYHSKQTAPGWDGKDLSGIPVTQGQFTYLIKIGQKTYKGTLSLLR
ncbi:MAG: gliding motility-associated C-terminal domain-containing protein, partial [Bacteroidia bacterium]|nr:gliding motility-associated C-terminal domain-containing protein [Bacteroidia bacterium]MDW8158734.1 gliding motility-associated C-terminal domain-containing protein [Bacteroidia bacterium]